MQSEPTTEPFRARSLRAVRPEPHSQLLERVPEVLSYRAPFLEDKLLRLGMVRSRADAAALFQEAKKFLILTDLYSDYDLPIYSGRVDECWHQFVLFTAEYAEFCATFVGHFFHHQPYEAVRYLTTPLALPVLSFEDFEAAYEAVFGALPENWHDYAAVGIHTRLHVARWDAELAVKVEGERAVLVRTDTHPEIVLCRVNLRARPALECIASWRTFYVRELPGLKDDEERVTLARTLVKYKLLDVAL